jgi:hypothetical protein
MRKTAKISAVLAFLLTVANSQPIAHAKTAETKGQQSHSLYEGQRSFAEGSTRYLLARRERASRHAPKTAPTGGEENATENASENTPQDQSQTSADSSGTYSSENTSESAGAGHAENSARDGSTSQTGEKSEPHTLLYYAIQYIGMILGVTLLLALISSSSVVFLAAVWHTLKLMNGGKKPSIG